MARFTEEELARLKSEVSLVRLVEASGVELKKHGADLLGLCPFHDDKQPSLVISPEKNLWHCLGACQAGGSVVDWVMRREGVSFREAVAKLAAALPSSAASAQPAPRAAPRVRPELEAEDRALLRQAVEAYHAALLTTPAALAYLAGRDLLQEEMLARFRVGFSGGGVLAQLGSSKALRAGLERVGLLRERGAEHFAGCVVVPVCDEAGQVVEIYGRKIDPLPSTMPHLYLPGPHRGVFNLEALRHSKDLIVCEALLDALTFFRHGFPAVTAAYGVNGFTRDHLEALKAYGIERVLIAYDRDDAGEKAAAALAKKLAAEGLGCFRVQFPRGMDANEYARKVQPAAHALGLVLESAEWVAGPKKRPVVAVPVSFLAASGEADQGTDEPEPKPAAKEESSPRPPAGGSVDPFERALGDRCWRVRGLAKNLSFEKLQVVLRVATAERFFVDSVELVSARQRASFVKQAALELGVKEEVIQKDLAKLHLELELLQDQVIAEQLKPPPAGPPPLSPQEEREALAFLRRPDLLAAILEDFDRCGVVGEETNKLLGYLVAVSRKLEKPLAVLVQSSSAAGKSALMEAILALVPPEDRVSYSAMTGQSLFYMGEKDLEHKVLAIAEEEGAERASYALKLLQSEGELSIASTGKDPHTGKLVTHEYQVRGPVALLMTTTSVEVDEELANRCIVLAVDEEREQTRAIHQRQREAETLEGLLAQRERQRVVERHHHAQRLLQPVLVANPYARRLTFLDDRTRTRRDHGKYLALIRAIALLHQHQRPKQTAEHHGEQVEYLEVTPADIATANRLVEEAFGRLLDDLPPQTRRFLQLLHAWVSERSKALSLDRGDFRFHRFEARQVTSWSYAQVRKHLDRLVELEYVLAHRAPRGQGLVYELLWNGEGTDGKPFLPGLIDPELLKEPRLTPENEPLTSSTAASDPLVTPACPPSDPRLTPEEKLEKPRRNKRFHQKPSIPAQNALFPGGPRHA